MSDLSSVPMGAPNLGHDTHNSATVIGKTQRLESPIFVGGAGSSGSSLLAVLFNRHPQVYCGAEASLFNKSAILDDFELLKRKLDTWLRNGLPTDGFALYPKVLPHAERDLLTPDVLTRCLRDSANTRQFIDAIQRSCLTASGKKIFAEKTPSNAYCFRQLGDLYPQGLLVHPIRDGRDVVCSFMRRGFDVFFATSAWLYNVACALSCRERPNYFEYRYEDLAQRPEAVLQQICERISIPFDDRMLESANVEAKPELGDSWRSNPVWRNNPATNINPKSIGQYKTEFNEADYAIFCAVRLSDVGARRAGAPNYSTVELLELLGYSTDPVSKRASWARARYLELRDMYRRNKYFLRRGRLPRRALTKIVV
ncbi:MAG: sulfotransferase [Pirellulales bacterium]